MKILLMLLASASLFAGTAVGLLALQGRLDHEGTRGIPLLSGLFAEPADTGGSGGGAEPSAAAPDRGPKAPRPNRLDYNIGASVRAGTQDPEPGDPVKVVPVEPEDGGEDGGPDEDAGDAAAEWRQDPKTGAGPEQYRPGRLFRFPSIQAGISVTELNRLLLQARNTREKARLELAALAKRKADLDAREADLEVREEQILAKIREVEQARAALDERIAEFERTVTLIKRDELVALKADAASLASFEPRFGAELILQWWKTEAGRQRAVKLLNVMDPDAANEILATMDAATAREILDQRAQAVRQEEKR